MTPEQEKAVDALFAAGDPGARVPERLPQRVAARLTERPSRSWQVGWLRTATVGLVLASSAGMGAAGVYVAKRQLTAPTVEVTPAAVKSPVATVAAAPRAADPVALEAQLVRQALEALQRGDVDGALAKLDEREQRFPAGVLQAEADAVRSRCGR
ncbi:MAG: hypothetical protein JNK82_33180 [Myxococcaceae bacterium]|nr:hypothetical protein [Myxococcaceae bacterium]